MRRSLARSGALALLAATVVVARAPVGVQGGRGEGPVGAGGFNTCSGGKTPTVLRAIAAETTAAKVKASGDEGSRESCGGSGR